jgi:hypothetical protein
MSRKKKIRVNARWDHEAHVWVAMSDDVPGLATEAEPIKICSFSIY